MVFEINGDFGRKWLEGNESAEAYHWHVLVTAWLLVDGNCSQTPYVWPHLFCGARHEKRREKQLKWSLAFRLYIGSFPCAQLPGPVYTARLGRVCFCAYLFSLGLCFAGLFVLSDLFVSHSFVFPWAVESSPLQFLALA